MSFLKPFSREACRLHSEVLNPGFPTTCIHVATSKGDTPDCGGEQAHICSLFPLAFPGMGLVLLLFNYPANSPKTVLVTEVRKAKSSDMNVSLHCWSSSEKCHTGGLEPRFTWEMWRVHRLGRCRSEWGGMSGRRYRGYCINLLVDSRVEHDAPKDRS